MLGEGTHDDSEHVSLDRERKRADSRDVDDAEAITLAGGHIQDSSSDRRTAYIPANAVYETRVGYTVDGMSDTSEMFGLSKYIRSSKSSVGGREERLLKYRRGVMVPVLQGDDRGGVIDVVEILLWVIGV
jgi:hypothetical protein